MLSGPLQTFLGSLPACEHQPPGPAKKNPVTTHRRRAPRKKIQSRRRPAAPPKKSVRAPRQAAETWLAFFLKNPVTPVTGFLAVRKIQRTGFSHQPEPPPEAVANDCAWDTAAAPPPRHQHTRTYGPTGPYTGNIPQNVDHTVHVVPFQDCHGPYL